MSRKVAIFLFACLFLPITIHVAGIAMPETPFPELPPPGQALTLFLCGDVMTGRGIDQVMPRSVDPRLYESYVKNANEYVKLAENKNGPIRKPISYAYIWGDALQVWQAEKPDLRIINLETSLTTNAAPWPGKEVQYRMHPANIPVLTAAGIDICSLANNHTLDWNRPGLLETLETLRKAGIAYAGAGKNLAEAQKPIIYKTGNGRVILFALGSETSGIPAAWAATENLSGVDLFPNLQPPTINLVKERIRKVKKPGDVVVISIHWGSNWGYEVPDYEQQFAHLLLDEAGADLVYGHSSHHPRPLEVYKNKLIIYGAGDFINDYEGIDSFRDFRGDLSLMYFPKIDPATGRLLSLKMVPMQMRNFSLHHASETDAKWLWQTLNRESSKYNTRVLQQQDGSFALKW